MFKRRRRVTVIAEGLNIKGNVTAEGLVEVHGEIEGELNCTTLRVSKKGRINGKIVCQDVVVPLRQSKYATPGSAIVW